MKPSHSKKKQKEKQKHKKQKKDDGRHNHLILASSAAVPFNSANPQQQLPLAFPQHFKRPSHGFLRDDHEETSYQASFQTALKTSYLGLVVDPPTSNANTTANCPLTSTLEDMQAQRFFQTDVTQPFGLGTKCAKTYVTRCLVGDPGTTYKYLGLRMFAYSWQAAANSCNDPAKKALCKSIGNFKDTVLIPRTQQHLQQLHQQRSFPYNVQRSRPQYNICLINRMDSSRDDYKVEPTLQDDDTRIAVAWHADSSLEHYSNIAVYQVLVGNNNTNTNQWRLAVRTTPNAEGPNIRADHTPDPTIPPLAMSLPSGATYYMLDDFNHHHQHAVLKEQATNTSDSTIRYSATYRLLRPSHTVQELLQQCQTTTRNFHKKGIKLWRSEQLLLSHLESEWLRQFYIQGRHHKDMLWPDWGSSIQELWKYWGLLEGRTKFVVDLLRNAAHGKCHTIPPTSTKAERKARDKQRKAWTQVQELMTRSNHNEDAQTTLYQPMADLLRERATLRAQWKKREKDHVFTTMEPQYRPLPWPVQFSQKEQSTNGIMADSPLSEDLTQLADQLVACGRAYTSGKAKDLPEEEPLLVTTDQKQPTQETVPSNSNHKRTKKNKNKKRQQASDDSHSNGTKKKKKRRY